MKIKWIPDVHRPESDFTAKSPSLSFKIWSWRPAKKLEVNLTIDLAHAATNILFHEKFTSIAAAKDYAEGMVIGLSNSIKHLQRKKVRL